MGVDDVKEDQQQKIGKSCVIEAPSQVLCSRRVSFVASASFQGYVQLGRCCMIS